MSKKTSIFLQKVLPVSTVILFSGLFCVLFGPVGVSAQEAISKDGVDSAINAKCAAAKSGVLDKSMTSAKDKAALEAYKKACAMSTKTNKDSANALIAVCGAANTSSGLLNELKKLNVYDLPSGKSPSYTNCTEVAKSDSKVKNLATAFFSGCKSTSDQDISCSVALSRTCELVVKEAACMNAIKDCTTPACVLRKGNPAKFGGKVILQCQGKTDPQACNTKLKEECKDKTGAKLTECIKDKAKDLQDQKDVVQANIDKRNSEIDLETKGDKKKNTCGKGEDAVETRIDLGCTGEVDNPILDMAYALVRFFSYGVGLVLAASIIWGGIQYSSSQGNPEATQAAKTRIQNAIIGLVFYLLIFAAVQFLVPGGLFNG